MLPDLLDSPFTRTERLGYLDDLRGILCAEKLFTNCYRAAANKCGKPIKIEMGSFDGLITTCPLHISIDQNKSFIQTIHDIIPLEWPNQHDHRVVFSRRLNSCLNAHKLFVSSSTQEKFKLAIGKNDDNSEIVVTQPPSLKLPGPHQRRLLGQRILQQSRHKKAQDSELIPFRYILFNSSIEPRKNLLLIINAFRLSGLAEQGIRLCITGKLKNDNYSKTVSKQIDSSILLTDYIDETTKTNLFLHALIILCPSLVEGFGIPLLDGACIGAQVIGSPSSSHLEIKSMFDFSNFILIADTREPLNWSVAMKDLADTEIARIRCTNIERQQRIQRYETLSEDVFEAFRQSVCKMVLSTTSNKK